MQTTTDTTHPAGSGALGALPFQAGEPVAHRGISVTPLFPTTDPRCHYVTLAHAIGEGLVVKEVDESGDVGEIVVVNPTPHRVLLYDGEEIAGAKQDRIMNVSVLVEAGAPVHVPVSCIEVGRWRHESDAFRSADRTPTPRVRRAKALHLAEAPLERGVAQSAVWDAVALAESEHGFRSSTSKHGDLIEHERPRLTELARAFPLQPGQCGMVVAAGGRAVCADAVSRPDAFAQLHGALLTGYLVDALPALDQPETAHEVTTRFLDQVGAARRTDGPAAGLGTDLRLAGDAVVGSGLALDDELIQLTAFGTDGPGGTATPGRASRIARPTRRR